MSPLVLLVALLAGPDLAPPAVVRVHDLARLTPAEAEWLRGRRAHFRVVLDSTEDEHNDFVLCDCFSPGRRGAQPLRRVTDDGD
jgi:hypothetical protein